MSGSRSSMRGFTLVEMSLVLVVIGLILGAVSIGRDMQRSAEYVKIKQKFVDQWVSAYNNHYSRTGVVVGDDQTAPRYMVNGAKYNSGATSGSTISGGDMSGVTAPGAICEGARPTTQAAAGAGQAADNNVSLHQQMLRHGIQLPPGRAEGFEDRYVYLDTNGNPQEIQVCFQWNPPGAASGEPSGNVMVITGLTPDLARALDQMIDGKADAREGVFRQENIGARTEGSRVPQSEWQGNNTFEIAAANPDGVSEGDREDEDQVMTLVAHYKMNQ
ncbi:type II secretion system protein [Marichromatium gracile]|uniref:Prepilin-type N-terminal cleavage/methylation domain-containing protein n=1 Tax=Marichromatium gracile TaxID=1048 RepID=A0A4R4AGL2_MARGR|nr:prepilin-type N-terminal cleavage/methylation domain-containing protein [Marichromatium gracile]MBK1709257.1 prepilin-type cleavage/methylation domain-containing protein [Marichromatium gracile]TCW38235.1 prepilin-type N-terminal cleavage/methylation domain-containing protein [Marichromatium gracile]